MLSLSERHSPFFSYIFFSDTLTKIAYYLKNSTNHDHVLIGIYVQKKSIIFHYLINPNRKVPLAVTHCIAFARPRYIKLFLDRVICAHVFEVKSVCNV